MGPGRTAEDNHLKVRVQTKVRGRLDVSSIKYPQRMSTWKKTVLCLRENRLSITEREVAAWTKNKLVPGDRLVVFLKTPCDAYKALLRPRVERTPPKPPVPQRCIRKVKMESIEGTPTTVLGDDQFPSSSSDEDSRSSTSSVMSNPKTMPKHDNDAKTMPKHDNDTKSGDHTPDVDHGVVNVATQETKSETVTESSEQSIHDLHVKTVP